MATLSQLLLQDEVTEDLWNVTLGISNTQNDEGMPVASMDSATVVARIGDMALAPSPAIASRRHEDPPSPQSGFDDDRQPFASSDSANEDVENSEFGLTRRAPSQAISTGTHEAPPSPLSSLSDSDVPMDDIPLLDDIPLPTPTEMEPPVEPRPTTSGKSMKLLEQMMAPKRKRVVLKLREVEKELQDDVDAEYRPEMDGLADESAAELDAMDTTVSQPRTSSRKRRRIVSLATIPSDNDSEMEVDANPKKRTEDDGWPTAAAPTPCAHCARQGLACRQFLRREKGHQRTACTLCRFRKRNCTFSRRRHAEQRGASVYAEESDAEESEADHPPQQLRRTRGKTVELEDGGNNGVEVRRLRKRKRTGGAEAKTQETASGRKKHQKSKGKGKARARSKSTTTEGVVKVEDDERTDWLAGKCLVLLFLQQTY